MRWLTLVGPRGVRLRCAVPERLRERMLGLVAQHGLDIEDGMLIPNATSVQTFAMRFPILVARLDASLRVVDVRPVVPWAVVPPMRGARHVLECHPDLDLRPRDELRIATVRRSRPVPSSP